MQVNGSSRMVMPQPAAPARRVASPTSIFTSAPTEDRVSLTPATPEVGGESKAPAAGPYPKAKWTVLNYCAADNNLYAYIYDDTASMEKVGSTGSVQLVTQFDRRAAEPIVFGWRKTATGSEPRPPHRLAGSAEFGSGEYLDPKTLSDFLTWGIKTFSH